MSPACDIKTWGRSLAWMSRHNRALDHFRRNSLTAAFFETPGAVVKSLRDP